MTLGGEGEAECTKEDKDFASEYEAAAATIKAAPAHGSSDT